MALEVVFITTTYDRLSTVPIKNGQIIALSDRSGYYYDHANKRFQVGGIITLDSPPQLGVTPGTEGSIYLSIEPPGLYFYVGGQFHCISQRLEVQTSGSGNVVTAVTKSGDFTLKVDKNFTAASNDELQKHINTKQGNPHGVTKQDIGLENVDNTHDADKTVKAATKLVTPHLLDGISFDGTADVRHDVVCSTPGATAAKTVTVPGFSLVQGAHIWVTFLEGITVSGATLSVNGTTPTPIQYRGVPLTDTTLVKPNATIGLLYQDYSYDITESIDTTYPLASATQDGLLSHQDKAKLDSVQQGATAVNPYDSIPSPLGTAAPGSSPLYARGDHIHQMPATMPNSETANKLANDVYISGVKFDGTKNIARFAVCDTAGDNPEKAITLNETLILPNLLLVVKFTNTNTVVPVTLRVNEYEKYSVKINGGEFPDAKIISADSILFLVFTGEGFEVIATSYSANTSASVFTDEDREKLDGISPHANEVLPSDAVPEPVGTVGSAGSSPLYSRADHVHAFVGSSGKATQADKLTTARNIQLTGDVQGSAAFDGSSDIQIPTTAVQFDINVNGIVPGSPTYTSVDDGGMPEMFLRQDRRWTGVMNEPEFQDLMSRLGLS